MISVQEIECDETGRPRKFCVTGASSFLSQVEVQERGGVSSLHDSEFTLNGAYCITPHNTYTRIQTGGRSTSPRENKRSFLSYQVLLNPLPRPKGEISVLRLHDGSLRKKDVAEYGLTEDSFDVLTCTEPKEVFQAIRRALTADVPDFVMYARKGTTN